MFSLPSPKYSQMRICLTKYSKMFVRISLSKYSQIFVKICLHFDRGSDTANKYASVGKYRSDWFQMLIVLQVRYISAHPIMNRMQKIDRVVMRYQSIQLTFVVDVSNRFWQPKLKRPRSSKGTEKGVQMCAFVVCHIFIFNHLSWYFSVCLLKMCPHGEG